MFTSRLSFAIVSVLACLPTVAQAQGPWPTMSQPSFFSPVQEFFTPLVLDVLLAADLRPDLWNSNRSRSPAMRQRPVPTDLPQWSVHHR